MGKDDDSGLIGERRGTSGFVRGPEGDHGRQARGAVPGKRTAVPEGRPVDPVTAFLRRLGANELDGAADVFRSLAGESVGAVESE